MCRNIKQLFNFDPPASREEMHAAALQFVRKVSGCSQPSKANEVAFGQAVDEICLSLERLLKNLKTQAPPRDRDLEAEKARVRSALRFPKPPEASLGPT